MEATKEELEAIGAAIRAYVMTGATEKYGLAGEELEAFGRAYDLRNARATDHAKRLAAGRKAGEITPEQSAAMIEELMEFMKKDGQVFDKAESSFRKRQRDTLEKMRAMPDKDPDTTWGDALVECPEGDGAAADAFLTLVEEQEKTKIRDWRHLQELTGIKEITGHDGKIKPGTTEAKEQARRELAETLKLAVEYRYRTALEAALNNGAKYKDLQAIDPEAFGVTSELIFGINPDWRTEAEGGEGGYVSWDEYKAEYREKQVLRAIGYWADLPEVKYIGPDLQDLAEELAAPYPVIFKAAQEVRFGSW